MTFPATKPSAVSCSTNHAGNGYVGAASMRSLWMNY